VDHAERRTRLVERLPALEAEGILITRLPNVRFLTGFTGSNGQVLVTPQRSVFFTDGRYGEQSSHEVPDLPRETYSSEFGPVFHRLCGELGLRRVAFESAGVTYRTYTSLQDGVELVPSTDEVEALRWVKTPEEVGHLEAAQSLADDAFDTVTGRLAEGMTELDLALELDTSMRRAGAEGLAFDTIAAFGENAAEPHHHPTTRALRRGDVVKLDFGCVVAGYHSDMTRTVAFGRPDPRLEEIYEIVRRAQQTGVEGVRAGANGGDVDRSVRDVIAEAGYGEHYTHSLGHGVGLEVHEGPSLRSGGKDVLPEHAVVTVEPGIYIGGLGGVRIEDMVEVTTEGCRVLPRTTKDLVVL
jgi:Xaa-Pro aminopeptidase